MATATFGRLKKLVFAIGQNRMSLRETLFKTLKHCSGQFTSQCLTSKDIDEIECNPDDAEITAFRVGENPQVFHTKFGNEEININEYIVPQFKVTSRSVEPILLCDRPWSDLFNDNRSRMINHE
jgi:hypothetical protein